MPFLVTPARVHIEPHDRSGRHIRGLQTVVLSVFDNNTISRRMYESFGFREYGRLSGGIRHRGRYVDHVWMYLDRERLRTI